MTSGNYILKAKSTSKGLLSSFIETGPDVHIGTVNEHSGYLIADYDNIKYTASTSNSFKVIKASSAA